MNKDLLQIVFDFVGNQHFLQIGSVCKYWKETYVPMYGLETRNLCDYAAENNNSSLFTWAKQENCICDLDSFHRVALTGKIDSFEKYVFEFDYINEKTILFITLGGDLNRVQDFLKKEKHKDNLVQQIGFMASISNHFHILKYLHREGYSFHNNIILFAAGGIQEYSSCFHLAIPLNKGLRDLFESYKGGNVEIVKWLLRIGIPWDSEVTACAARYDYIGILKFAHSMNLSFSHKTCKICICNGHYNQLTWLYDHGYYDVDFYSSVCAVKGNNMEILKFVLENGGNLHAVCFEEAVYQCNLEMIKFIYSQGIRPSSSFGFYSYTKDSDALLHAMIWLQDHDFKVRKCAAIWNANLSALDWILDTNRNSIDDNIIFIEAVSSGNLAYVRWCVNHGFLIHSHHLCKYIFQYPSLEMVRYLHEVFTFDTLDILLLRQGVKNRLREQFSWVRQSSVLIKIQEYLKRISSR